MDRGTRMSRRIERTLERSGIEAPSVLRNHEVAMAHRRALLPDDHHPHFLHPGRTVLVAVGDAELRDPALLALAPLLDSLHPELAPGWAGRREAGEGEDHRGRRDDGGQGEAGAAAALTHAGLPPTTHLPLAGLADPVTSGAADREAAGAPAPDDLMETLVTLDPDPLALVLSEALDHLRHLHLAEDAALRRRVALRCEAVLLPLAGRMGGTLDRRYRWWWRRVGRGFAQPEDR